MTICDIDRVPPCEKPSAVTISASSSSSSSSHGSSAEFSSSISAASEITAGSSSGVSGGGGGESDEGMKLSLAKVLMIKKQVLASPILIPGTPDFLVSNNIRSSSVIYDTSSYIVIHKK
jgi:hypothetical protein